MSRKILLILTVIFMYAVKIPCFAENTFEINGYLNMRYLMSRKILHSFQLAKTNIKGSWNPSNKIGCGLEAYFYTETNRVKAGSIYGEFRDFPELGFNATGKLVAGRARNYCFGMVPTIKNRRTSEYGIVSDFLTRRRVTGIQYMLDHGQVNVNFGIFNGFEVGTSTYGSDGNLITLNELQSENNKNKEVSIKFSIRTSGELTWGFSGSSAELTEGDLLTLNALLNKNFTSRSYSSYGVDFVFDDMKHVLQGEIYNVLISKMDTMAYEILGGIKGEKTGVYLRLCYITYGGIDSDKKLRATLDKLQITPSFRYSFAEKCWAQVEGNLNTESEMSAADALENSLLFAELHFGF